MKWSPKQDTISLKSTTVINELGILTKRIVLSLIAQVFDPLGLYLPSTVRLRWFFSSLNSLPEWDSKLSESQSQEFKTNFTDIQRIYNHNLTRCLCLRQGDKVALHVFSDASTRAYELAYI